MKKINISFVVILLVNFMLLTACGGGGGGSEANVDVNVGGTNGTSGNVTADAGPDQNGSTNSLIQLDASISSGAEGSTLSYTWSFDQKPANSIAIFSDLAAVNPTFQPDLDGTYVVKLVVSDGIDSAEVFVTVRAFSPVANAGANQTVSVGSLVSLDGSASSDGSGLLLNYLWEISLQPDGSTTTIPLPAIENPTFVTDVSGTYVVSLIVNNGIIDSVTDTITITAVPPTADAGSDQTISTNTQVTLDGSASSDVSSLPLDYSWQIISQPVGSTTDLLVKTVVNPTFIPDVDGAYVIGLIVSNGTDSSTEDSVIVVSGTKPLAIAGADQDVSVGEVVSLDGTQSNDANVSTLSYSWSFDSVPTDSNAFLGSFTSDNASFTPDLPGEYTISLIVNNGSEQSDPDTLIITASLPIADGGGDQNVEIGSLVQLNSNSSSDPNGYDLTYDWRVTMLPVGSSAVLSDTTVTLPTFTADLEGEYLIELTVNNGFVDSDPLIVTVNARTSVGESSGIFSTSFEGASGNDWSASNGVWEVGVPTSGSGVAYVGQKLAATNLDGNYIRSNSILNSPSIQLTVINPATTKFQLRLWHSFLLGTNGVWGNDLGIVYIRKQVSVGVWDTWVELKRYSGNSGGWSNVIIDISSSFSGELVQLGFGLSNCGFGCGNVAPGWYIDEILIDESAL